MYEFMDEIIERVRRETTEQVTEQVRRETTEQVTEQVRRETTEQVHRESILDIAKKLLAEGGLSLEKISALCDLPIEKVRELAAEKESL